MPRSCDRLEGLRTATRHERLRRVIHALADASERRHGLAHSAARHAAGGQVHRRGSRGQRAAPSLRPRCRIARSSPLPIRITSLQSGIAPRRRAALLKSAFATLGNGVAWCTSDGGVTVTSPRPVAQRRSSSLAATAQS
jgi:hypothetical protein